jgi:hypothetical protein
MQLCGNDGRSALVMPNKVLSAEYSEPLRRLIAESAEIDFLLDYSQAAVFTASVYPVVLGLRRSRSGVNARLVPAHDATRRDVPQAAFWGAPSLLWAFLLEDFASVIESALPNTVPLTYHAEVSGAATVAEAYGIAPAIRNLDSGAVPPNHAKFVVSGNLRRGSTTWETAPVQYLKQRYMRPVVDLARIPAKRRAQALAPKIIISGLSKRPVAFLDSKAEFLAGKSTVLVMSDKPHTSLEPFAAILNSELGALLYSGLFGGLALAGGYLRFGPPQVGALPVPRDMNYLTEALRHGTPAEDAVCSAYGVDRSSVRRSFLQKFGNLETSEATGVSVESDDDAS